MVLTICFREDDEREHVTDAIAYDFDAHITYHYMLWRDPNDTDPVFRAANRASRGVLRITYDTGYAAKFTGAEAASVWASLIESVAYAYRVGSLIREERVVSSWDGDMLQRYGDVADLGFWLLFTIAEEAKGGS